MTPEDTARSVVKSVAVALSLYGLFMGLRSAVADSLFGGVEVAPWLTASGVWALVAIVLERPARKS